MRIFKKNLIAVLSFILLVSVSYSNDDINGGHICKNPPSGEYIAAVPYTENDTTKYKYFKATVTINRDGSCRITGTAYQGYTNVTRTLGGMTNYPPFIGLAPATNINGKWVRLVTNLDGKWVPITELEEKYYTNYYINGSKNFDINIEKWMKITFDNSEGDYGYDYGTKDFIDTNFWGLPIKYTRDVNNINYMHYYTTVNAPIGMSIDRIYWNRLNNNYKLHIRLVYHGLVLHFTGIKQ